MSDNIQLKTVSMSDGRRLRIEKTITEREIMDDAIEKGGNGSFEIKIDAIREEMAGMISKVISKIMPIHQTSMMKQTGKDEIVISGDIYLFTPDELRNYTKNIIEESKLKGV